MIHRRGLGGWEEGGRGKGEWRHENGTGPSFAPENKSL